MGVRLSMLKSGNAYVAFRCRLFMPMSQVDLRKSPTTSCYIAVTLCNMSAGFMSHVDLTEKAPAARSILGGGGGGACASPHRSLSP